jgi:hypothetical protein
MSRVPTRRAGRCVSRVFLLTECVLSGRGHPCDRYMESPIVDPGSMRTAQIMDKGQQIVGSTDGAVIDLNAFRDLVR